MRPSPSSFIRIRSYLSRWPRLDVVPRTAPIQRPIEAAYYRGGTSRAVIIQPRNLPKKRSKWPSIFRQIIGSGDPYGRQLDGMGAGISSFSKICLVEPYGKRIVKADRALRFRTGYGGIDAVRTTAEAIRAQEEAQQSGDEQDVDIDYTFVGLGIENDEVDVAGNCGNMSSAIGPYAYNASLLPPKVYAQGDGEVTVRIRNTNTCKMMDSTFDVVGGEAAVVGGYTIDGVTGSGSMIKLNFKDPYGSKTGKMLPTGKKVDIIEGYRVSCVDGANPVIFIRADDIGVDGTILPNDFNKLPEKLRLLERIRKAAAVAMGIARTEDLVPRTIPKIGLVSQSSSHPVLSGQTLKSSQIDIVIRFLSDTQPHRAIPLTGALTTAVAARIQGTIVEQLLAPDPVTDDAITIGHASGRLQANATMKVATVYRTAKRLFDGNVFWTDPEKVRSKPGDRVYSSKGRHSLGLAFVLEHRGKSASHLFDGDVQEEEQQDEEEVSEELEGIQEGNNRPLRTSGGSKGTNIQPATPLTTAMLQLRAHLTDILTDPDFSTRPYPPDLLQSVESSYQKILANSRARNESVQGKKWHDWAKSLHKRKKSVRESVKKKRDLEEKAKRGVKRTTRRELGLDTYGIAAAVRRRRKKAELRKLPKWSQFLPK